MRLFSRLSRRLRPSASLDRAHGRWRGSGYNRWLIPPAALAIHLAVIGCGGLRLQRVFNLPLTRVIGIAESGARGLGTDDLWAGSSALPSWSLGLSAALFGKWLESAGPAQGDVRLGSLLQRRLPGFRHSGCG